MQAVSLNVPDEIKALGDAFQAEYADIKAKKGTQAYIGDALPALISLAGSYQALAADIKNPDAIAYLVKCVASAFLPVA